SGSTVRPRGARPHRTPAGRLSTAASSWISGTSPRRERQCCESATSGARRRPARSLLTMGQHSRCSVSCRACIQHSCPSTGRRRALPSAGWPATRSASVTPKRGQRSLRSRIRIRRESEIPPVSQAGEEMGRSSSTKEIAVYDDAAERDYAWADLRSTVDWFRNNRVLVAAILLIVVELVWKAQFLSHMYFRQDDFH